MVRQRKKWVFTIVAATPLLIVAALVIMSFTAPVPSNLGIHDGRLAACPTSPNAVSTTAPDPQHKMEPFSYEGLAAEAISRLQQIVSESPHAKIITVEPNYLHAEYTSRFFRFTDDVEFYCDEAEQLVHFRSASRVGHSDFGVNRKRMKKIFAAYSRSQL